VAAFCWGFLLDAGEIELVPPAALSLTEWSTHTQLLTSTYPSWEF
jgi:hypothetical protein